MMARTQPGTFGKFTYDKRSYPRIAEDNQEPGMCSVEDQGVLDPSGEIGSTTLNMGEEGGLGIVGGAASDTGSSPARQLENLDAENPLDNLTCAVCSQLQVEPCTLQCGHSFCQLCLANLWHSKRRPTNSLQLSCPVCRQPWRSFPAVNIQLRNIIQQDYKSEVDAREEGLSPADHSLLELFSQQKQKESSSTKHVTHLHLARHEVRRMFTLLWVTVVIALVVLAVLFCCVLWVWAGAGGEFMRKPVEQWGTQDVLNWLGGLGEWTQGEYSELFKSEKITGPRLLLLNEEALETIGVHNAYRRSTILQAISELKKQEFSSARNFHEFKAAHRKQTLLVALFYKTYPRLMFVCSYVIYYYEVFLPIMQHYFPSPSNSSPSTRQLCAFFMEVFLIPHFLVGWYAWSWFDVNPWICTAIIIHCVWSMWKEAWLCLKTMKDYGQVKWKDLLQSAMKNCLFFVFLFFVLTFVWHILPHFFCDILFYLVLWHTLYMHVAGAFFKKVLHLFQRVQRVHP